MIDENFLNDTGLAVLPDEVRMDFIKQLKAEISRRVGKAIVDRLTERQLADMMATEEDNSEVNQALLVEMEDPSSDPVYQKLCEKFDGPEKEKKALKQYLKLQILEQVCPDYREIASKVTENLKNEILASKQRLAEAS